MSEIKTRIRVKFNNGKSILYTTDRDTLESFNLEHDQEFSDLRIIEEGTVLDIFEKKYKVVSLYSYFYDEMQCVDENTGINLYGKGENQPFNFDITYYVELIK